MSAANGKQNSWRPRDGVAARVCLDCGGMREHRHANAIDFIRRAAHNVYTSKKFEKRGEFGELFLHIAIRQVFDSLPAMSKIYYKSANNDPVKGFDEVYVVGEVRDLELWIGEAKFYDNIDGAIRDVVAEIREHTQTDYLRSEFALITNKIDDAWQHANALKKLLDPERPWTRFSSEPVYLCYSLTTAL